MEKVNELNNKAKSHGKQLETKDCMQLNWKNLLNQIQMHKINKFVDQGFQNFENYQQIIILTEANQFKNP